MFSETYIKMCEKAEEIQRLWEPKFGDYIYSKAHKSVTIYPILPETEKLYRKTDFIWLPTQKQLQDILHSGKTIIPIPCLEWQYIATEIWVIKNSFEELWLAFVMYKLYNKQWNADKQEWVDWRNECLVGFT